MDAARFLTLFSVFMGLGSAALMLILSLSLSTPLLSLSLPEPYSLLALKSMCVDYFWSMWSLLHHSTLQPDVLLSSRNLFLLVNLIVLVLLINLHLQKHAAPAAAGKRSSKKKNAQHTEKLAANDYREATAAVVPLQQSLQGVPLADDFASQADMAMAKEGIPRSVCAADLNTEESSIAEGAPAHESYMKKLDDGAQAFPAVDSDGIDGSNAGQIVLVGEDERLKFDGGLMESVTEGSDAEKIVQLEEEDGRLMELFNGSDEEKIVLEEDGRLRLIDKPQLLSSSKPQKSHSTGDKNVGKKHLNCNYETQSPDKYNYDIDTQSPNHTPSLINHRDSHDNPNLNHDDNYLSEFNNGALVLDLSASAPNNNNLNDEDAHRSSFNHNNISNSHNHKHNYNNNNNSSNSNSNSNANSNKSLSIKRTSSRPMRAYKKAESMDATWKAINNNKGSAGSSRDHRGPLIRQTSRQGFKPSGRGLTRSSNTNSKVRREPSISQEELNAKVESFIAKFNEQIRIQRQQSILSYMQMVDRGA